LSFGGHLGWVRKIIELTEGRWVRGDREKTSPLNPLSIKERGLGDERA